MLSSQSFFVSPTRFAPVILAERFSAPEPFLDKADKTPECAKINEDINAHDEVIRWLIEELSLVLSPWLMKRADKVIKDAKGTNPDAPPIRVDPAKYIEVTSIWAAVEYILASELKFSKPLPTFRVFQLAMDKYLNGLNIEVIKKISGFLRKLLTVLTKKNDLIEKLREQRCPQDMWPPSLIPAPAPQPSATPAPEQTERRIVDNFPTLDWQTAREFLARAGLVLSLTVPLVRVARTGYVMAYAAWGILHGVFDAMNGEVTYFTINKIPYRKSGSTPVYIRNKNGAFEKQGDATTYSGLGQQQVIVRNTNEPPIYDGNRNRLETVLVDDKTVFEPLAG